MNTVVSINRVLEAEEKRGYHDLPLLLANTWSNQLVLSALWAELSSVAQENFVFCRVSLAENAVLPSVTAQAQVVQQNLDRF